ncbi:hypothetical protein M9H77_21812 [Catharanthus roseus]|uniref:Uncharacterized protein n=1 Tax=Catharanthus roseus TaxID=4058 RepID=A0ACC0AQQ4_CATRO|nr:hypothetical protein M9H77_21812 [Catharanthus roseus]
MTHPSDSKLHIALFPWLATGHFTPFLHLANQFAIRGHKVSYLLPRKPMLLLQPRNLFPDLITFHLVSVPHVEGLPLGTENLSDVTPSLGNFVRVAFDSMRDQVENLLRELKPSIVFYDLAFWIPECAASIGFKTVCYNVVSAASIAIALVPAREIPKNRALTAEDLMEPPTGYPSSTVVLRKHEALSLLFLYRRSDDGGVSMYDRIGLSFKGANAIAIRTCNELEGPFCNYLSSQFQKPVFVTGPILPEKDEETLIEDKLVGWLGKFKAGTVIYCAFGSELNLEKPQFQELVLGFEKAGFPFLIALKPPTGACSIEEALPEGFSERVKERGVIVKWVQQTQILKHKSIGCFVSHCGFGSMWESLMSNCQIVLVPFLGDQILNTRVLCEVLKVAVEVEKDDNGWFSKESLSNAITSAMDKDGELGCLMRKNHAYWKETLMKPEFMSNYVDNFISQLYQL